MATITKIFKGTPAGWASPCEPKQFMEYYIEASSIEEAAGVLCEAAHERGQQIIAVTEMEGLLVYLHEPIEPIKDSRVSPEVN